MLTHIRSEALGKSTSSRVQLGLVMLTHVRSGEDLGK